MKQFSKVTALFVASYMISHTVVLWSFPKSKELVEALTAPTLGVVAGLLIGAVGVFLGSLGNLYAVLKTNTSTDEEHLSQLNDLLTKISQTAKEVKHNVFFVLAVLCATLLLPFLGISDIPGMSWPFQADWLAKQIVFAALNLCLTALAFVAIFDCVGAMFLLHHHYEAAITEWLNKK